MKAADKEFDAVRHLHQERGAEAGAWRTETGVKSGTMRLKRRVAPNDQRTKPLDCNRRYISINLDIWTTSKSSTRCRRSPRRRGSIRSGCW